MAEGKLDDMLLKAKGYPGLPATQACHGLHVQKEICKVVMVLFWPPSLDPEQPLKQLHQPIFMGKFWSTPSACSKCGKEYSLVIMWESPGKVCIAKMACNDPTSSAHVPAYCVECLSLQCNNGLRLGKVVVLQHVDCIIRSAERH